MGLLLMESSSDHTFCSIRVSISKKLVVTMVTRIHPETSGGRLIFRNSSRWAWCLLKIQLWLYILSLKHKQLQNSWFSKGRRW